MLSWLDYSHYRRLMLRGAQGFRAAAFKRDVAMHLSMDADAHARALLRAIAAAVASRHITEV